MQYLARMGRVITLLLVVFLHSNESRAQYPAGSPVAVNGKLKVIGRYLRNECGNPVQLRGMATHGVQWYGNCVNASSIDALAKDWNADVLRISMYIQEGGYVNNPTYWKGWIDNVVDECGKKGIYAIIDFHVHIPGDPMSYINEAREFWTYMSTKHKDKKHVLYEICNEPNGVTWSRVKEYANEVIPLIRAIDPSTVIIVGSSTWSQDVDKVAEDRLNFSNLIYSLHYYTHGSTLLSKAEKALGLGLPIFVTEFGTTNPQNTAGPFLDAMEIWNAWERDNKISWANWSFSDKGELSAALVPGSCGSGTWSNTSTSGTWVKSKIQSPVDNFVCNGDTSYVKSASTAYTGTPVAIPGLIEAEQYDLGVNGSAFRNFINNGTVFRTDGPEITAVYDGTNAYAIGSFEVGEWVNYSISASQAGVYDIQLRIASNDVGRMLYMEIDGKNVSKLINVPYTTVFETITVPNVAIGSGLHDLKLHAISAGVQINSINIVPSANTSGNRKPQITVKSPSAGVIYCAPSTLPISAFASDADGTITKVEFYNGTTKIGEDAVQPYSMSWTNTSVGVFSLTAVAIDNAGGVTTSLPVTVNVQPVAQTSVAGTGLKAEYFNNKTLFAPSVLSRVDTTINFSWGNGSPDPKVNSNQFSARWTGKIRPDFSGQYTFYLSTDDGVRLYIDNVPVVLQWRSGIITTSGTVSMVANALYDIRLEYYDDCCAATAQLSWSSTDIAKQIVPKKNLYPQSPLNIPPVVQLVSPTANTPLEAPASISLQATASDIDGSISKVLFYNGNTLIAEDNSTPYGYVWEGVAAGTYPISAVAVDDQNAQVSSSVVIVTVVPVGSPTGTGLKAEYFNNKTLSGSPVLTRTDANVDFNWLNGSPAPEIGVNLFSARWTGYIQPLYTEEYTFFTTSDDGVRLYVNDELIVNNWTGHASTVNTGKVKLVANQKYKIRLEYYDDCCAAEIRLAWSSTSQVKQAIPQVNLFPETVSVVFPVVSIASPLTGATFTAPATIPITVNASDADGSVAKVEFYNGATKIGESTVVPFSFSWTSTAVGSYILSAKAIDNEGNATSSSSVAISVSSVPVNQVPVVSISVPLTGATFTAPATVSISATANDPDGTVAKVEFFNGTTKLGEDLTSPFAFSWTSVATGTYVLSAKAIDNSGGIGNSSNVTITVNPEIANQLPTVALTAPIAGATFTAPATVAITTTAADADGTVAKVEFYNGATKIGEDLTSPYTFSWTSVVAGTYVLSAKATDNVGATANSSTVTITVNPAVNQAPTVAITAPVTGASFTAAATISITVTASDVDGTVSKVEFYNGTTKIGEDLTSPYAFSWTGVAEGSYTLSAKATDNSANVTTAASVVVSVTPGSNGNCTTEALPAATNWVVRNQWSDQSNNSSVANDVEGLKVTHRAWGQDQLYLIQTGKKYNVSSSNNYIISFDFKNDATMAATTLEIGIATGASGSGPVALQPLSSIPAGTANGSFSTKSVTIKPVSSTEVSLAIGLKWPGQINKQFVGFIKNISVCTTSVSARVDEESVMMGNAGAVGLVVNVSPNPSDHSFHVQLNGTQETVTLSVSDVTGELVYEAELPAHSVLSIGADWNKGLYILKVQDGNDVKVSKLQKN